MDTLTSISKCRTEPAYQIIYINGPSSAGKSTLSRALQQALDQPYMHAGIDQVIEMMPVKINNWKGGPAPEGFSWKQTFDESGHPLNEIQIGPFARKIISTFKQLVLTMAKDGHYIIVDDVAFGKKDVDPWREILKDYKVLWVGIKVPLPLLEEREKARGDRLPGSARAQYNKVHQGVVYDLEFDTSQTSLEEMVKAVKEKLCKH